MRIVFGADDENECTRAIRSVEYPSASARLAGASHWTAS